MSPIVADGADLAFAKTKEKPENLDGKMVVAWVEGQPVAHWFQFCERHGVFRAENPITIPPTILIDLEDPTQERRFRRVLWINIPH